MFLYTVDSAIDFGYEHDLDYHQAVANFGRQRKQQNYDQIITNQRSLYKERTDFDHKSVDDNNDFNKTERQEVDKLLSEVTSSLDKIKDDLIKLQKYGVVTELLDIHKRHKRNATLTVNATKVNITNNVTTTKAPLTATVKVKALRVNNATKTVPGANNDTINSRRNLKMQMTVPPSLFVPAMSRVKDKLLSYLADTFKEIENKIRPLTDIKIALSNNNNYKIGYIIATIDTLEVNLNKLKAEMYLHQHDWDENRILDLFDRIKTTNRVTSSLLQSLRRYL